MSEQSDNPGRAGAQQPKQPNRAKPPKSLLWLVLGVGIIALALDLWSKSWALNNLVEGEKHPFIGDFITLQLIHNPGAAFSLGAGSTWIFTILSVIILGAILWYATKVNSLPLAILLGIIAGGAAGNLWDRLTRPPGFGRGYVVDFLNYNDWFIGNVADIWIVGGALALVVWKMFDDAQEPQRSLAATDADTAGSADEQ